MTDTKTSKDPLRYRAYYRLMDLCLIGVIGVTIDFAYDKILGSFESGSYPTWYIILGVVLTLMSFGLAPFLILARFMRDEYAELLWKRTANVVLYVITIAPYAYYLSAWAVYFIVGTADFFPYNVELSSLHLRTALFTVGTLMMGTFVIAFQFLRWRDSR